MSYDRSHPPPWWKSRLAVIALGTGLLDCGGSQNFGSLSLLDAGSSTAQGTNRRDAAVDAYRGETAGSVALGAGGEAGSITRGSTGGSGGNGGASMPGGSFSQGDRTGDAGSGVAGAAGRGGSASSGDAPATFSQVYSMVLAVPSSSPSNCAGASCHIPGAGQSRVKFDTKVDAYRSLVSLAVIPGDSAGSTLYTNLATGVMPMGRPMLSDALIALVASWIDAGALND